MIRKTDSVPKSLHDIVITFWNHSVIIWWPYFLPASFNVSSDLRKLTVKLELSRSELDGAGAEAKVHGGQ